MFCVIGAVAVDVLVRRDRFVKGTSNPASIRMEPGGVGYRIFSGLPEPKRLYTALGADVFGRWLAEQIADRQELQPIFLDRFPTASYCAFMESGKLLYGASDMQVVQDGLSWPQLRARLPELGAEDMLVLEANLAPTLVRTLIRRFGGRTRVVFEAVSVEKLLRHQEALADLYLLSANEDELRALGRSLAASPGSSPGRGEGWIAGFMSGRRIAHLLVSRGSRGARLYTLGQGGSVRKAEEAPRRVVAARDTTGAGDRLLAAVLDLADGEPELAAALPSALDAVSRALKERP